MVKITIGTTPTIIYTFSIVDPANMTEAVLTIKVGGAILIEKDLDDATVGENTLSWTLTQAETLSIGKRYGSMMVNWLTDDGTRGASTETQICGVDNHIAEVMT